MPYTILVTAAIIEKEGKFLIAQRLPGVHNALRWEFPGGKPDFGEDPRIALKREIKEELDIEIKVKDIFECSSFVYGEEKHVILLAFLCDYISGEIKKLTSNDFAWVSPVEMDKYDITEADIPFVEKLKTR